ncbi:MAG: hypothetical protein M1837_003553 [Sclerophora amabilis]|nr:MAG: hypothetical protein M1837_003553 [Sclerophora amabilis]
MNALQTPGPRCTSCSYRLISSAFNARPNIVSQQQFRGKNKAAKIETIKVRLLQDVDRYGRKGTILSVQPGRMRNSWYPHHTAEYLTPADLRALNISRSSVLERDPNFRIHQPSDDHAASWEQQAWQPVVDVDVELLSPQRATQILSVLLPPHLTFYRGAIAQPPQQPQAQLAPQPTTSRQNMSRAVTSAAADLAAAAEEIPEPVHPPVTAPTGIYGSVSTADIASNIRALLAEHAEGSRVVLGAEDVTFVGGVGIGEDGAGEGEGGR